MSALPRARTFAIPWQALGVGLLLLLPMGLLVWLLGNPRQNREIMVPVEHLVIVTNVALLALVLAVLLARAAIESEQYPVLLVALGFMSLAGLFAVHAIATPGIIVHGGHGDDYGGTVIGLSAYLSLFVPSLFFVARYLPKAVVWERGPLAQAGPLLTLAAAALAIYAVVAIAFEDVLASLPFSSPPTSYGLAAVTLLLLGVAAWRQAGFYYATGFPMQGALAVAYVLLGEAQISMVLAPMWTLAWWEYHVLMLGAVALALWALFIEMDRRRGLERFLPSTVVERVLSGDALRLQGERRVVTIMFVDLRDSTQLAERLSAEEVVDVLNTYLGTFARCVFEQVGMLDKFLGDGLMAIFGALGDATDGAVPAARAAASMRSAVSRLNQQRERQGQVAMRFGIGIHTGEVVLGAIGSPERSDYTAIGDTVNTAARLESLCKIYGVDTVLSAESARRLHGSELKVESLGDAIVAGKAQAISVSTLA
jgi:class 3 adenylate cyclase